MIDDGGMATCLDVVTGEVKWEKKLLYGDVKVYFFNNEAMCQVVKAGPEDTVLSENQLEGTMIATPAVSQSRLYTRTHNRLYAIRTGATAAQ